MISPLTLASFVCRSRDHIGLEVLWELNSAVPMPPYQSSRQAHGDLSMTATPEKEPPWGFQLLLPQQAPTVGGCATTSRRGRAGRRWLVAAVRGQRGGDIDRGALSQPLIIGSSTHTAPSPSCSSCGSRCFGRHLLTEAWSSLAFGGARRQGAPRRGDGPSRKEQRQGQERVCSAATSRREKRRSAARSAAAAAGAGLSVIGWGSGDKAAARSLPSLEVKAVLYYLIDLRLQRCRANPTTATETLAGESAGGRSRPVRRTAGGDVSRREFHTRERPSARRVVIRGRQASCGEITSPLACNTEKPITRLKPNKQQQTPPRKVVAARRPLAPSPATEERSSSTGSPGGGDSNSTALF